MATAILARVDIDTVDCANCAVVFGVPARLLAERRKDGQTFYCPNGHGNVFRKTEADRLREDLATTQARLTDAHRRAELEANRRQAAERTATAYKGQVTRLRKRAVNGVCPCCTRSFANVARHMATKHPDYTAEAVADG